jgi:hypothetical protein
MQDWLHKTERQWEKEKQSLVPKREIFFIDTVYKA